MRVPSGKISAERPSRSRAVPWFTTWFTAEAPAPRSTAMERSCHRPQPKNGMYMSSRLRTMTFGGPMRNCAKVSQAEECFHSATWGSAGMFSSPITRCSSPQIRRSAPSMTSAYHAARPKRRGSGSIHDTHTKRTANSNVHANMNAVNTTERTHICGYRVFGMQMWPLDARMRGIAFIARAPSGSAP